MFPLKPGSVSKCGPGPRPGSEQGLGSGPECGLKPGSGPEPGQGCGSELGEGPRSGSEPERGWMYYQSPHHLFFFNQLRRHVPTMEQHTGYVMSHLMLVGLHCELNCGLTGVLLYRCVTDGWILLIHVRCSCVPEKASRP